ncbi:MAG: hypothetical protein WB564_07895 [Dehalococcoidia bacterium]
MEEYSGNWYILIWNLDVEELSLKLGSGVSIRRLDYHISVFDLAAAGAAGFREWAMLEPFLPRCVCEIETAQDAAIEPGYDTLNRAWLASALIKLKGFNAHLPLACSSYSWNFIAGQQERTKGIFEEELKEKGVESAVNSPERALPPFKGQLLEVHTRLLVPENVKTILTKEDADWINDNYEKFNYLAAKSEGFRFALSAAVDWQYASDPRMAISQLWSGIEALFGISSEVVYRISLQVASLLEERGVARQDRFNQVKKLYGARSKAVHGEELSDDKLNKAMLESFDILNKLLLVNIEKGRPFTSDDFEAAIFY